MKRSSIIFLVVCLISISQMRGNTAEVMLHSPIGDAATSLAPVVVLNQETIARIYARLWVRLAVFLGIDGIRPFYDRLGAELPRAEDSLHFYRHYYRSSGLADLAREMGPQRAYSDPDVWMTYGQHRSSATTESSVSNVLNYIAAGAYAGEEFTISEGVEIQETNDESVMYPAAAEVELPESPFATAPTPATASLSDMPGESTRVEDQHPDHPIPHYYPSTGAEPAAPESNVEESNGSDSADVSGITIRPWECFPE